MSLFGRLIPNVLSNVRNGLFGVNLVASSAPVAETAGGLFTTSIRTMIRCHFPRPSERKRVKRHGWKKRLSTEGGRAVLMRRILKGRHVYSH